MTEISTSLSQYWSWKGVLIAGSILNMLGVFLCLLSIWASRLPWLMLMSVWNSLYPISTNYRIAWQTNVQSQPMITCHIHICLHYRLQLTELHRHSNIALSGTRIANVCVYSVNMSLILWRLWKQAVCRIGTEQYLNKIQNCKRINTFHASSFCLFLEISQAMDGRGEKRRERRGRRAMSACHLNKHKYMKPNVNTYSRSLFILPIPYLFFFV